MLEELPDVEDLIRLLPVKDAAVQLKLLTHAELCLDGSTSPEPFFEYGKSMFELPFSYSKAELAMQAFGMACASSCRRPQNSFFS